MNMAIQLAHVITCILTFLIIAITAIRLPVEAKFCRKAGVFSLTLVPAAVIYLIAKGEYVAYYGDLLVMAAFSFACVWIGRLLTKETSCDLQKSA